MSWQVGLHLGEVFAEVTARREGQSHQSHFYLPQTPIQRGLRQFLETNGIDSVAKVRVSHKIIPQILQRGLGSSPAFLVTAGFENWLEMSLPVRPGHFTLQAVKQKSPIDRDLVFGLSERILADGTVERGLDLQELEFLVAKLQLSRVTQIAVGLLHSQKNPVHEREVAEFFRARGFGVHASTELAGDTPCPERSRWWAALLDASVASVHDEMWKTAKDQIREAVGNHDVAIQTSLDGVPELKADAPALWHLASPWWPLFRSGLRARATRLAYFGLEDFALVNLGGEPTAEWQSEFGRMRLPLPPARKLGVQPDQLITSGFWGCAEFSDQRSGFEPGPMALGKGLKPTFLDALFASGLLGDVPALRERLNDRARARIIEILSTYSRGEDPPVDVQKLPERLVDSAARRLAVELEAGAGRAPILCAGPLAKPLSRALRPYMMAHQLHWVDSADFTLSTELVGTA